MAQSPKRRAGHRAHRRFSTDRRGNASVEFAFIAPVLLIFYFGVVEISLLLTADRKITAVAAAVGDLIAQTDETDAAEVNAIFDVAAAIMQPLASNAVEVRVTSLAMSLNGDVGVTWSRARNTPPLACNATVNVPAGVLTPGQSVIITEVSYTYAPPIGQMITGDIILSDMFFLRPRKSLQVEFNPAQC